MYASELREGMARHFGGPIAHDEELGIRYGIAPDGAVTGTVHPLPAIEDGNNYVAQGALATVMDTISGIASMACMDFARTCVTLNLRIDYLRPMPAGRGFIAYATPVGAVDPRRARSMVAKSEVGTPTGDGPFAVSVGRFFMLAHASPPKPPGDLPPPRRPSRAPSYAELMGMAAAEGQHLVLPFRAGLIGNGTLPSLHGGVIVSLLQDCAFRYVCRAVERPLEIASVHVSFLKLGRPEDLIAVPRLVQLGRSTATLNIVAHQGGTSGGPIAEATVTFVSAQSADG
ncbi:PaaI family thioesterase [Marinobacter sp. ATCH36]|uniref:PaaI family thioesterase n=1 Tax=Marinobacter sp. ATCH36 TaxID=2945106 RepID=UPI002020EB43|nr:PaaI family thioesterase [Marinobacter sp. ATCH36]MCL7946165.1 PaaI family thioesterase [Marinobacter sp. ATCH36]